MIRHLAKQLALGLIAMAAGYALKRLGRWMQDEAKRAHQPGAVPSIPRRPIDVYESMFMDMPEMAEWLGPKYDPERWN